MIEPFLYDLILLLDRIELMEDEVADSIRVELLDILERRGVNIIDVSSDFNPKLNKAVRVLEKEGITNMYVSEVVRNGYLLSGKVIRPAEVVVVRPARSEKD